MRLIEHSNINNHSESSHMILVRHGVDVPNLSKDLNQPLTEETKPDIRILGKQMIQFFKKIRTTKIIIHHSNRLRSIQTTDILAEELFDANFSTEIYEAVGVREIYQGNFKILENHVHGTEYKPLVDAWSVWQQKLNACELLYRFGDPVVDPINGVQHPELVGWFEEFGEHQADFSLRLYRLLADMFESVEQGFQIIIGHQASCSRIQRILDAVSKLKNEDQFDSGNFVKYLEKQGDRKTIEPACGVVIKKPDRTLMLRVLKKEIKFLESII